MPQVIRHRMNYGESLAVPLLLSLIVGGLSQRFVVKELGVADWLHFSAVIVAPFLVAPIIMLTCRSKLEYSHEFIRATTLFIPQTVRSENISMIRMNAPSSHIGVHLRRHPKVAWIPWHDEFVPFLNWLGQNRHLLPYDVLLSEEDFEEYERRQASITSQDQKG